MSISVLGGVPLPNSEASFGGGVGSLAMIALLPVRPIDEPHHSDSTHQPANPQRAPPPAPPIPDRTDIATR